MPTPNSQALFIPYIFFHRINTRRLDHIFTLVPHLQSLPCRGGVTGLGNWGSHGNHAVFVTGPCHRNTVALVEELHAIPPDPPR